MPAARYWRVTGLEAYSDAGLELSELQLYDGTGRADAAATLTCSHAPGAGALSSLGDGSTSTSASWPASAVRSPGFALVWDLGSGVTKSCIGVRVGSGLTSAKFLAGLTLECLDGGAWTSIAKFNRFPWPGANTMGPAPGGDYAATVLNDGPALYWRLGETTGTTAADSSGNGRAGTYTANASTLTTAGLIAGTDKAILLPGTTSATMAGVSIASTAFITDAAFTFECVSKINSRPVSSGYCTLWQANNEPLAGSSTPELATVDMGGGTYKYRVMSSGIAELFLSSSAYAYGTRRHVALRYTPGTVRLVVDGVDAGSASYTYGPSTTTGTIGFSKYAGVGSNFYPMPGTMDEVAFYNRDLGDAALAAHAAAMDTVNPTPQVFLPRALITRQTGMASPYAWYNNPGSVRAEMLARPTAFRDLEFGGIGRVRNTVKEKGAPDTPVHRRVRLVRERDGLVVREQWSNPATGAYDFQFVDALQTYTVLSYDHTLNCRAVSADGLTLANGTVELMP